MNGKPHQQLQHAQTLNRISKTLNHNDTNGYHHYSQPVTPHGIHKSATTDRHFRLTQDYFNQNYCNYGNGGNGKNSSESSYIHNNSHYSLPIDNNENCGNNSGENSTTGSPPPTPPPPALPHRNGSLCNTNGRRSMRHYH